MMQTKAEQSTPMRVFQFMNKDTSTPVSLKDFRDFWASLTIQEREAAGVEIPG